MVLIRRLYERQDSNRQQHTVARPRQANGESMRHPVGNPLDPFPGLIRDRRLGYPK